LKNKKFKCSFTSVIHAGVSKEEREKAGITDDLIRLSVGCDEFDDLKGDLEQALAQTD
jgi:cystathionine beta-lyase/cystathionine gamma-synthase